MVYLEKRIALRQQDSTLLALHTELCIIHKVFGGKLPTLSNQDVEELSVTLGRTPSSIRSEYGSC